MIVACGSKNKESKEQTAASTQEVTIKTAGTSDEGETIHEESTKTENEQINTQDSENSNSSADTSDEEEGQLLQSASMDLDDDGANERVEAVQVINAESGEKEGRLRIKTKAGNREITFCAKDIDAASILSGIEFEDLDGDGAVDVFIVIPDNGASFSFSTYFTYSMKKDKSYAFTADNELNDFISNFNFKYSGGSKLAVVNDQLGFSADLNIELDDDRQSLEESMNDYEMRSWIEQVPVNISESSMISLVNKNGTMKIKVPLPIFGVATVDMIGELDLYYRINESFEPVLDSFDVLDMNNNEMIKAGSCKIK
jgi:hypothetical protein